jgi:2-oxo-4-hydroxy-4-carboxy--5-ureidoimidazoline (OHCU) decarboxylase
MRDLPRQLSADELAELFEGRTRLVERLAELEDPLGRAEEVVATLAEEELVEALAARSDPLGSAREVLAGLSREQQVATLNAHPAIGARDLSARSAEEQGLAADPAVLTELACLNQVYEEKFGFRFVVFVNRRPKPEILEELHSRLERTREDELETALSELVAIARDRWERS